MTVSTDGEQAARQRAVYDEYTVGESAVGMLSDPLNEHAWMYSTAPVAVEP